MIQVTTDLFAVSVPMDAQSFLIDHTGDLSYECHIVYGDLGRSGAIAMEPLPKESKWQILGTVSKDEIGFDCEAWVGTTCIPEPSFRSLLQSVGIYWVNPKTKPADDDYSFYAHMNVSVQEEWRDLESKKQTGKILIIKKLKT